MAEVGLTINGRTYRVACQDGEEDRLRSLGAEIDQLIAQLSDAPLQPGETRLMLMAALVIADGRSELRERVTYLEKELERLKAQEGWADAAREQAEIELADSLQNAAERIQNMAKRLDRHG